MTPIVTDPLTGFEMIYMPQPDDYSGAVRSTLVFKKTKHESAKAILYVHGFSDYFLQKEMAEMFAENGYNFYAVDLRKYGRSLLPGQKMFRVRDLHEYFPDIDSAIEIMRSHGMREVALLGHSTGGLITSLYMSEKPSPLIKVLMLNSPFLDWNLPAFMKKAVIPFVSALGRIFPNIKVHQKPDRGYAETLSAKYGGEWDYRTDWKPDILPDPDMGWVHAIQTGQQLLRRRKLHVPVLLMHSSESVKKGDDREKYFRADAILDVESISRYGRQLGDNVTEVSFAGGLHDLALSKKEIRGEMYAVMLEWLGNRLG
ncbi:MAG: alpha/beta hydrolase [Muribaculaceae bacterium]|nr:alpha/beta hydrolase [Muribaculaceae bacterium]